MGFFLSEPWFYENSEDKECTHIPFFLDSDTSLIKAELLGLKTSTVQIAEELQKVNADFPIIVKNRRKIKQYKTLG